MKNTNRCPKCGSDDIVRVPDTAHRYLANSICITKCAWVKRVPVARYVCCGCGYVENWVEDCRGVTEIRQAFG
ncbi:MAG: hypothetical protein J1E43_00705 [Christensenellaceae bacterium]|nr:hypothetical protein [Christensenellaceae bacterium]